MKLSCFWAWESPSNVTIRPFLATVQCILSTTPKICYWIKLMCLPLRALQELPKDICHDCNWLYLPVCPPLAALSPLYPRQAFNLLPLFDNLWDSKHSLEYVVSGILYVYAKLLSAISKIGEIIISLSAYTDTDRVIPSSIWNAISTL